MHSGNTSAKRQRGWPAATAILLITVFSTAVMLLASGCGDAGGATVTLKDLSFEPATVTIKTGQSVTWKNEDRRIRQVMSGAPPVMTDRFMSPEIDTGQSWSFKFEEAGEFPFHDMKIPNQLGIVIVQE